MYKSFYHSGYYDEFGRTHVVMKTEKGYMTFSIDILIKIHRIRNNKTQSQNIPNHPFIGKSFYEDNKKKTITSVHHHFGFGDYYTALYVDENGSGSYFTILDQGSSEYEKSCSDKVRYKFIIDQLRI